MVKVVVNEPAKDENSNAVPLLKNMIIKNKKRNKKYPPVMHHNLARHKRNGPVAGGISVLKRSDSDVLNSVLTTKVLKIEVNIAADEPRALSVLPQIAESIHEDALLNGQCLEDNNDCSVETSQRENVPTNSNGLPVKSCVENINISTSSAENESVSPIDNDVAPVKNSLETNSILDTTECSLGKPAITLNKISLKSEQIDEKEVVVISAVSCSQKHPSQGNKKNIYKTNRRALLPLPGIASCRSSHDARTSGDYRRMQMSELKAIFDRNVCRPNQDSVSSCLPNTRHRVDARTAPCGAVSPASRVEGSLGDREPRGKPARGSFNVARKMHGTQNNRGKSISSTNLHSTATQISRDYSRGRGHKGLGNGDQRSFGSVNRRYSVSQLNQLRDSVSSNKPPNFVNISIQSPMNNLHYLHNNSSCQREKHRQQNDWRPFASVPVNASNNPFPQCSGAGPLRAKYSQGLHDMFASEPQLNNYSTSGRAWVTGDSFSESRNFSKSISPYESVGIVGTRGSSNFGIQHFQTLDSPANDSVMQTHQDTQVLLNNIVLNQPPDGLTAKWPSGVGRGIKCHPS